jgi:cytochrome P450 family 628
MTTWFRNVTFDIMGDLGFGQSFALSHDLDSVNKTHFAITSLQQGFRLIGLLTPIPWMMCLIVPLALLLPWATQRWTKAITWTAELCDERVEKVSQAIDADEKTGSDDNSDDKNISSTTSSAIFSRIIRSANQDGGISLLERFSLYGDTMAMIIAGSDTTSGVLTMLFYELAAHVDIQNQLREEIAAADISFDEPVTPDMLNRITQRKIPYLDACINEAMRLHPVLPTGGIRQTVDKGFYLDEEWIPPDTILVTPRWSIMRREWCSLLYPYLESFSPLYRELSNKS